MKIALFLTLISIVAIGKATAAESKKEIRCSVLKDDSTPTEEGSMFGELQGQISFDIDSANLSQEITAADGTRVKLRKNTNGDFVLSAVLDKFSKERTYTLEDLQNSQDQEDDTFGVNFKSEIEGNNGTSVVCIYESNKKASKQERKASVYKAIHESGFLINALVREGVLDDKRFFSKDLQQPNYLTPKAPYKAGSTNSK